MAETVKKKAPNPTGKGGFKKGCAGGPGRGHKAAIPAMGEDAFADMKAAYTTQEQRGESPGVQAARRFLREDYPKFMATYAKLGGVEEAAAAARDDGPAGAQEEAVEKLIEKLLAEWGEEEGKVRAASGFVEVRGGGDHE